MLADTVSCITEFDLTGTNTAEKEVMITDILYLDPLSDTGIKTHRCTPVTVANIGAKDSER